MFAYFFSAYSPFSDISYNMTVHRKLASFIPLAVRIQNGLSTGQHLTNGGLLFRGKGYLIVVSSVCVPPSKTILYL